MHSGVQSSYRPRLLLRLYECEACDSSRQVREAMCVLDLDYICLPCPSEHVVHAPTPTEGRWKLEAHAVGGRAELPMLIDPNTDDTIVYGDDIVPYLWEAYGPLYGELDVTVVEARNLNDRPRHKRSGGLSLSLGGCTRQAFAEVLLLGCPVPELQTEVKPHTLDPVFDETFSYGITSDQQVLQVTIKDKGGGVGTEGNLDDAFCGRVLVPLSEVIGPMLLKRKLERDALEAAGVHKEVEDAMTLENKLYLLQEEKQHPRRSGTSQTPLGLVELHFEFRPRQLTPDANPWQTKYLCTPDQCPQLKHETCGGDSWLRSGTAALLLVPMARFISMIAAALARPMPEHGIVRRPNRMADDARELAIAEVGAENLDGSINEKPVREYLATLSQRRQSLLDVTGAESLHCEQEGQNSISWQLAKGMQQFVNQITKVPPAGSATGIDAGNWLDKEAASLPQLFADEVDAGARSIRELLCTLEVPYCRRTTASGSRTRIPWELVACEHPKRQEEEIVPDVASRDLFLGDTGASAGGFLFRDPISGFCSANVQEVKKFLVAKHATGPCRRDWLIQICCSYCVSVLLALVRFLLLRALLDSHSFLHRLVTMIKEELLPEIQDEVYPFACERLPFHSSHMLTPCQKLASLAPAQKHTHTHTRSHSLTHIHTCSCFFQVRRVVRETLICLGVTTTAQADAQGKEVSPMARARGNSRGSASSRGASREARRRRASSSRGASPSAPHSSPRRL